MKTMKKISGLLAATLLLSAGTAFGQSDDAPIGARASVLSQIVVTAGDSLIFGNVAQGVPKTISTTGTVITGAVTGGEDNGTFTITKGAGSFFTLSWTLPANLAKAGGGTLPINFNDAGTTKLGLLTSGSTSFPFSISASGVAEELDTDTGITGADRTAFAAATSFVVAVGGTVVPTTDQAAGNYIGTITMTATYN